MVVGEDEDWNNLLLSHVQALSWVQKWYIMDTIKVQQRYQFIPDKSPSRTYRYHKIER